MGRIQSSMHRNIFIGVEALAALERFGTVSEAAARLRVSQPAVSKRLAALQSAVGVPLIEPEGRKLRLTADAIALLDRARPLLAELRDLVTPKRIAGGSHFSLALADS